MTKQTILAVDDDLELLDTHVIRLSDEGWHIITASSLPEAEEILNEQVPDLMILDRTFESRLFVDDSLNWLPFVRSHDNPQVRQMPILMLTHRDNPDDAADGIEAGAIHYVNKPFTYRLLILLIKRILDSPTNEFSGQAPPKKSKILHIGQIEIHPDSERVLQDGHDLSLSDTEYRLLMLFATRPNDVLSKDDILMEIWDETYLSASSRLVDNFVKKLRQKANANSIMPIFTVHGRGYVYRPTLSLDHNTTLDFRTQTVICQNTTVTVPINAFKFITAFAKRKDKKLTKYQLVREVWGEDDDKLIPKLDTMFAELRDQFATASSTLPIVEADQETYRYRGQ